MHNQTNARAQLNPNRRDSTLQWMKLDIVTQWVTAHGENYAPFCRACPGIRENGSGSKFRCGACSGAEQLDLRKSHQS